jgi:hypothetical protein
MPTIMDAYNTGLAAARNQIEDKYLDPMLKEQLYANQIKNKYLDPSLYAQLYKDQTKNKYLDKSLSLANQGAELTNQEKSQLLNNPLLRLLKSGGASSQIAAAMLLQNGIKGQNKGLAGSFNNTNVNPSTHDYPSISNADIPQILQPQPLGGLSGMTPISRLNEQSNIGSMTPIPQQEPNFQSTIPEQEPNNSSPQQNNGLSALLNNFSDPNAKLIVKSLFNTLDSREATTNLNKLKVQGANYLHLPIDYQAQLIAYAGGMGVTPTEASKFYMNGGSLEDLAKQKGVNLEDVEPIYAADKESIKNVHMREQALTEMDSLGKTITEWTAPYAKRFGSGTSVKAIVDALSGENKDDLAKFLAAKGLVYDQAAIRGKALGGKIGETVLNQLVDSTMSRINFPTYLLNEDLYKKTQQYVDKAIKESVSKANKVGLTGKYDSGNENKNSIIIISPDNRKATGSEENINKFLKDHPDWKRIQS